MRALGFSEEDVLRVLLTETFMLGTLAIASGVIVAFLLTRVAGLATFGWFPSFDIFLHNGHLSALFSGGALLFNTVAVYLCLLFAVVFPARRVARSDLPDMLAGGMKG
jgi:ABC-type antimicrobial peptide transport system permease subunit